MAKFGAAAALGIIDAGGRNVTIGVQTLTGSLSVSGIVGMVVFTQYWYWFPLTHFLSLSFVPTSIIGLDENLNVYLRPISILCVCGLTSSRFLTSNSLQH